MQQLFFWRRWAASESALYSGFLIVLALLSITVFILNLLGPEFLIGWETYAQPETINIVTDNIESGLFDLKIEPATEIFWQFFTGGENLIPVYSYHLFLLFLSIGIVTITTAITFLKRFWYFVGVSLLIAGLASLNFDLLYLFGQGNKLALGIALALFVPATYYFNKVNNSVSFIRRWLFFLAMAAILGVLIHFFADTPLPFMSLATSSIYVAMILSAIFLLMIGHEIIIAMLTLLTSGQSGALRQFLIFCAVYLLFLLFTYLHEVYIISWDIIYMNIPLLMIISSVLGLWGFRKREEQYSYLTDFSPAGAFFYLGMMCIALATFSHLQLSANDPGIDVLRDFTIIGHLAFGTIFLAYILANFATPLGKNMAVHKILFQPNTMPYFTFRLAGIIMFVAMILPSGTNTTVFQVHSAYYNGLGDLAVNENEPLFAMRYYEEGASHGYNNHKSNYSLGKFYISLGSYDRAIAPLLHATKKRPTPQSFVDLGRAYLETNQPYEALFLLTEGARKFNSSYELLNNLGLAYNEVNVLDSAYLSLHTAHESDESRTTSGSNITGMFAKNAIEYDPDSVIGLYVNQENRLSVINGLILKSQWHSYWEQPAVTYDSVLTYLEASLLYNSAINALYSPDTISTAAIRMYSTHPANTRFRDKIELAEILHLYRNKQVNSAFRKLNSLANWSNESGHKFYEIGGMWALSENAPEVALQYFGWAADRQLVNDHLYEGIALSEMRNTPEALKIWQEIAEGKNPELAATGTAMAEILTMPPDQLVGAEDTYKQGFLRYRVPPQDTVQFLAVWNTIADGDSKARSMLHECKSLVESGRISMAVPLIEKLSGIPLSSQALLDEIKWMELELIAARGNVALLARQINDGVTFDAAHEVHKQYFTGLVKAASNDESAIDNFRLAASMNPFYEDAVVTSAGYISESDRFEAYDLLINALEINPSSVPLLKAYILQCARTQLDNYADISLETLSGLIPQSEFNSFYTQYVMLANQLGEENEN